MLPTRSPVAPRTGTAARAGPPPSSSDRASVPRPHRCETRGSGRAPPGALPREPAVALAGLAPELQLGRCLLRADRRRIGGGHARRVRSQHGSRRQLPRRASRCALAGAAHRSSALARAPRRACGLRGRRPWALPPSAPAPWALPPSAATALATAWQARSWTGLRTAGEGGGESSPARRWQAAAALRRRARQAWCAVTQERSRRAAWSRRRAPGSRRPETGARAAGGPPGCRWRAPAGARRRLAVPAPALWPARDLAGGASAGRGGGRCRDAPAPRRRARRDQARSAPSTSRGHAHRASGARGERRHGRRRPHVAARRRRRRRAAGRLCMGGRARRWPVVGRREPAAEHGDERRVCAAPTHPSRLPDDAGTETAVAT